MLSFASQHIGFWRNFLPTYPKNPHHPFHGFYGNEDVLETTFDLIYPALTETHHKFPNGVFALTHECPVRISVIGPRSSGKTDYAKRFAELLGTPLAKVDGTNCQGPEEIVERCMNAWISHPRVIKQNLPPIAPIEVNGMLEFDIPPMTLFIDEIHATSKKFQDRLLTMTDPDDGFMVIGNRRYNFKKVSIIIATTQPGKLDKAFKSRFEPRLQFEAPDQDTVAKILQNKNKSWSIEACRAIAKIRPTPRQALGFAKLVGNALTRKDGDLLTTIETVRKRLNIYRNGLSPRSVAVLGALSVAKEGLSRVALLSTIDNMEEEEFSEEVLGELLPTPSRPGLIKITNRHFITDDGISFLQECHHEHN